MPTLPVLSSGMADQLTSVKDIVKQLIIHSLVAPGGTSNFAEVNDIDIAFRPLRAEFEHDRAQLASAYAGRLNRAASKYFENTDDDVVIDVTSEEIDAVSYKMIINATNNGTLILDSMSFEVSASKVIVRSDIY